MDYNTHFRREVEAFEAAARQAVGAVSAPEVATCPGWSMADLVIHLGGVHRGVATILRDRLGTWPDTADRSFLDLPADRPGWPRPERTPNLGPVPAGLLDWFAEGAARLAALFDETDPSTSVWTWAPDHTAGFWLRMQTIEAAVHRWDAESVVGTPKPVDAELAADAVTQTFEVMTPMRRAVKQAPAGSGERFRFRRTDGPGTWLVHFDGHDVRLDGRPGPIDVDLSGTASDLALFLWGRVPADDLDVDGDLDVLDTYFTLVPPL
ncbi:MAG TPA: maleylpyruvate isomerase family mycothiol-dependent enzyme [Pseudonocardiaceae bacterium]|jgi:uncharacterized protein (TIGR03083 family)|nr:maleylpyruvate isomerase family mycothiol-dependent enzyme [Pseudonocardiaceae bacterium]